ncbi:hypothetical protein GGR50DRAFT_669090 [Xylaria sp. CBS 124048]|nr:hypothetical protein GGR50DRAFT_669090 [Xylaria sp. CBS 124048]
MAAQTPTSVDSLEQSQSQSQTLTPTRTTAPYGHACLNCVKAKCKCVLVTTGVATNGDSKPPCERCTRLGRECKPSGGVRGRESSGVKRRPAGSVGSRAPKGRLSAASRTANLEQRLEDLMTMLKRQAAGAPPDSGSSQSGLSESHQPGITQNTRPEPKVPVTPAAPAIDGLLNTMAPKVISSRQLVATPASATSTDFPAPTPASIKTDDIPMTAAQAEETLDFFRQHHLKFFPFVHIPPGIDAARLQRDRPFLWLTISAVCCKSPIRQATLSKKILEEIAQKMLLSGERSLDMLLGTLCALGWAMHFRPKPILSVLMGMATSILIDLRLDKSENDHSVMHYLKAGDFSTPPQSASRTMEERRATLACYVCCSSVSSFLRCQSMRWTAHMEESLKILTEHPECENDQILVLMVKVQRLSENLAQTHATWALESETSLASRPPMNIYVKFFLQDLQAIKDQVPESLWDNRLVTALIMSAEMFIMDMPFYSSAFVPGSQTGAQARPMDIGRAEASFAALQATANFLKHYLTFELSDLVGLSVNVSLNFSRALQMQFRLRLLDYAGWERSAESNIIDLLAFINNLANRYSQLPSLYGFLTETDADGNEVANFYVKCSKMLKAASSAWQAHLPPGETPKGVMDISLCSDAVRAGPQVPPAIMGPGLNPNPNPNSNPNLDTRVNYPAMNTNNHNHNHVVLSETPVIDFPLDDAWYNEMLFTWDPNIICPGQ